jgi:hypothetical protein
VRFHRFQFWAMLGVPTMPTGMTIAPVRVAT